jgi:hypothetical protein
MVLIVELFASSPAPAQGTLYVSNVGQTPTGNAAIGSDSWIAQSIITGTNFGGYVLDSVQLLMDAATGSPNGFSVSIYSSLGGAPHNNLGNLVGPDPSAGGVFSYTASSLELSPATFYFVVVTAATPVAQGTYVWSGANGPPYVGNEQWTIYDVFYSSSDGSTWTRHARENVFQMAVYADAVPEPSTLALAGLGPAALSLLWRRRKMRRLR